MSASTLPTALKQVQHSCGKAKYSLRQVVKLHAAISLADDPLHENARQKANGESTARGHGGVVSKPSRGMVPELSCSDEKE